MSYLSDASDTVISPVAIFSSASCTCAESDSLRLDSKRAAAARSAADDSAVDGIIVRANADTDSDGVVVADEGADDPEETAAAGVTRKLSQLPGIRSCDRHKDIGCSGEFFLARLVASPPLPSL